MSSAGLMFIERRESMPKYYPIMLDVRDRPAIVIGGDRLAAEKATNLLACGARVTAISPAFGDELHALAEQHVLMLQTKSYEPGDLAGAFVVVAVTSEPQLIEAIWREAQQRGQLVNIVDVPAHCNFILPSILRRGQLTIAVSTEGASPSLAKRIRQQLEGIFPSAYDMYMQLATVARTHMRRQGITYDQRDNFFSDYFTSDMLTLLSEGKVAEAIIVTAELLQHHGVAITAETITTDLREAATSHDSYTTA
ncbi:MAG: bifunctional precorrin-2 dehydrogenase/sirohydrochlorin ferrochelatase [Chloroflexi bacterium]|nr:MAG: bifunctional precorrin-2 dehydrogenase/sirohydrochlorin ferrochelatase [Chloroflexota bacterium]